jgi:hypothetical protein
MKNKLIPTYNDSFENIKKYSDSILNIDERILYLEKLKTEFLQNKTVNKFDFDFVFPIIEETPLDKKISLEVEYIKKQKALLKESKQKKIESKQNKTESNKMQYINKFNDLIFNHAVEIYMSEYKKGENYYKLIIDVLLKDLNNISNNNEKIIYLHTISQYNAEQIIDIIEKAKKEEEKKKDLEKLKDYQLNGKYHNCLDEMIFLSKGIENIIDINHYIKEYLEKLKEKTPEESKAGLENTEPKLSEKKLNKFTLYDTEENIILLFNVINQVGIIKDNDFDKIGSILQDTFLNSKGNSFVNTQINKVKTTALNTKKLTQKKNLNLILLRDTLNKLIQD